MFVHPFAFALLTAFLGSILPEAFATTLPSTFAVEQDLSPSALIFNPVRPQAGSVVEVEYQPLPELAMEERLHLRARLRTPDHESYNDGMGSEMVAVLRREEGGTFHGSFQLPEDVVFAVFAVENEDASRVDGREGRFWELLVSDEVGRPLLAALEQRFHDHMGRDEVGVMESAREMVGLYPDDPLPWTALQAAEMWFLGEEGADERETEHLNRALEFDRAFRGRDDLTVNQVAFLYWYLQGLYRIVPGEVLDRWRERLLQDFPGHFFAAQERARTIQSENPDDPAAVQAGLEALWSEVGEKEAKLRVLREGLYSARENQDEARLMTWAARWRELDPAGALNAAYILSTTEGGREEGISMISERVEAAEAAADADRPLGATKASHRASSHRTATALKEYLGNAIIQAGRAREGIGILEEAAAQEWRPEVFRSLGEAYMNLGEPETALRHFAALAADPGISGEAADSLRLVVGVDAPTWREAVAAAEREMIRRTLDSSTNELLPAVRLTGSDGSTVSLQDRMGAEATVVVMWSQYCGHSNRAMPQIENLTKQLAEQGVPFLALTRDGVEESRTFLEEESLEVQALYDVWGEAGRALNAWGTPYYYVLDGEGRLRYAETSLEDITRQVIALRSGGGGEGRP